MNLAQIKIFQPSLYVNIIHTDRYNWEPSIDLQSLRWQRREGVLLLLHRLPEVMMVCPFIKVRTVSSIQVSTEHTMNMSLPTVELDKSETDELIVTIPGYVCTMTMENTGRGGTGGTRPASVLLIGSDVEAPPSAGSLACSQASWSAVKGGVAIVERERESWLVGGIGSWLHLSDRSHTPAPAASSLYTHFFLLPHPSPPEDTSYLQLVFKYCTSQPLFLRALATMET